MPKTTKTDTIKASDITATTVFEDSSGRWPEYAFVWPVGSRILRLVHKESPGEAPVVLHEFVIRGEGVDGTKAQAEALKLFGTMETLFTAQDEENEEGV